jgi:hypothetical protein
LKSEKDRDSNSTKSRAVSKALPLDEAIRYLAGDDKRPMIVVRECRLCNGTNDALLSRELDNTRTLLMTRWFQCVKLPMDILKKDHPFHALFDEEHPPHLFICRWDGSGVIPLRGDRSRSELWKNMETMLKSEYLGNAAKATSKIEQILHQYDLLDLRIARLETEFEEEIEDRGPKSRKLKKMRKSLDKAIARRDGLKAQEKELSDLGLKYPKVEKEAVASR